MEETEFVKSKRIDFVNIKIKKKKNKHCINGVWWKYMLLNNNNNNNNTCNNKLKKYIFISSWTYFTRFTHFNMFQHVSFLFHLPLPRTIPIAPGIPSQNLYFFAFSKLFNNTFSDVLPRIAIHCLFLIFAKPLFS